jgi:CRISPR-associated endonuclease Cas3-HD
MVVYSYRGERLAEHSYLVLRLYCGAFGGAHERLVAKRVGADPALVVTALRTACLLHDVGKALSEYQERIKRGKGAPFHEVVGACLTYETLSLALFDEGPVVRHALSFAAAYAVLQHHQAMRGFREALHSGLTHLLQLGGGIDDGVVEEVRLAARMAEHLFDAGSVLEAFKRSIERVSREGLCTMLQEFMTTFTNIASGLAPASVALGRSSEWATTWGRLQTALPLFSAPLQLCDYLAAYLARGGRLRALHREMILMLRRAPTNFLKPDSASTPTAPRPKPRR